MTLKNCILWQSHQASSFHMAQLRKASPLAQGIPALSTRENAFSSATATWILRRSSEAELAREGRAHNPQPDTPSPPMKDSGRANPIGTIVWPEETDLLQHPRNQQPSSGFQGQTKILFFWRATNLTLDSCWVGSLHVSKGRSGTFNAPKCNQFCVILFLLFELKMVCLPASTGEATLGEGVWDRCTKISRVKV